MENVTATKHVRELCGRLSNGLHPHPDIVEADWQCWLEGYTEPQLATSRRCPECGDHLVQRAGKFGPPVEG